MRKYPATVRLPRCCAVVLAAFLPATAALAQTPLSGNVSGTLAAGIYTLTGSITVPTGQTLTLDPGVIIKVIGQRQVIVNGTLLCNGTPGNPVIFTDDADDSAGGDTNNNGPSTGVPGAWYNIDFRSTSDQSVLNWTEVRFAGTSNFSAVQLSQADVTLDHCTVRDCSADAFALGANSYPSITNCSAIDNGGRAFDDVLLMAIPGLTDNVATGNSLDVLLVTGGTINANLTLSNDQMVGGAFHFATSITVSTGVTLTCDPGTVAKFVGARQLIVNGTLLSNGTPSNPVIFTDYRDDTAGGDTNKNGPSTGVPGGWYNLDFRSTSDQSVLTDTEVRFAGTSAFAAIQLSQADITADRCTVRDCNSDAFALGTNSFPIITNCSAIDNGGRAFDDVLLMAVPGLTNNAATGNSLDVLRVTSGTVSANLTLSNDQMVGGAFHFDTSISINTGVTLTCTPGTIAKFVGARQVIVNGTLLSDGTPANPVIWTDYRDDNAGGDTNKNGPSTGVPGAWYNLDFRSSADQSVLTDTEVRFAGTSNFPAIQLSQADITADRCTVRDCNSDAFALGTNSFPIITNCSAID
ncbi:MAG: hypothetical protein KAI24_03910, partial [Planctomycetes bacterium]|nr:hypothetical protein [Planctomycetota bacterium]